MPFKSIFYGGLLILVGLIGYIYGLTTEKASITALIPAFFGTALALLGALANWKESLLKHLMHVALLIALLCFLASAGRLVSKFSEITFSMAYISQILMAVICLSFIIQGVKSFKSARQNP